MWAAIAVLSIGHLKGEGWDPDQSLDRRVTFVSLGSHCEGTVFLNAHHLRNAAFPFDWLLTCQHDRFLSILETDFAHFLDGQFFIQHPKYPYVLENIFYQAEFRHEWFFVDSEWSEERSKVQWEEMGTKYHRRINRFRELRNYPGKVVFLRIAYDVQNDPNLFWGVEGIERITQEQAQELKNALDCYFPGLNFRLVIVNYLENEAPLINGIENVFEFKISKADKHSGYANLFNILQFQ